MKLKECVKNKPVSFFNFITQRTENGKIVDTAGSYVILLTTSGVEIALNSYRVKAVN